MHCYFWIGQYRGCAHTHTQFLRFIITSPMWTHPTVSTSDENVFCAHMYPIHTLKDHNQSLSIISSSLSHAIYCNSLDGSDEVKKEMRVIFHSFVVCV